jgi:drug/metabolite transporter (DMT)-like permease
MRASSALLKRNVVHTRNMSNEFSSLHELTPLRIGGPPKEAHHQLLVRKYIGAIIYILSGATQPLLMTIVKTAGLADPTCQVYMLAYYLGPSMLSLLVCAGSNHVQVPMIMILKASGIALIDIIAQATNYTGATLAGPTIFAIIYSSVTVWTAIYSRIIFRRKLRMPQWIGIFIVFGGLAITAKNSVSVGPDIFHGAVLVIIGSSLHAMTYVLSEAIMGSHSTSSCEKISVEMNCAIQGVIASAVFLLWQIVYTRSHFEDKFFLPMKEAGTSIEKAFMILISLSVSNLVHAYSFFYTLKHFPGGASSAGIMKGVQAVLVFIFSSLIYCGSIGGDEMCFSTVKFISLVIVIGGVLLYSAATDIHGSGTNRLSKLEDAHFKEGTHVVV